MVILYWGAPYQCYTSDGGPPDHAVGVAMGSLSGADSVMGIGIRTLLRAGQHVEYGHGIGHVVSVLCAVCWDVSLYGASHAYTCSVLSQSL